MKITRLTGVHRHVKARLLFYGKYYLIMLTCDCNFVNLSSIFTIFSILVNNDIVDMPHDFGSYGNYFVRKLCVTIPTKIGVLLNWLMQGEYRVHTTV